jgi:hypothetical protein
MFYIHMEIFVFIQIHFSKEGRMEIILMSRLGNITYDTVAKFIEKFKKPGSVIDQPTTDEGTTDVVLTAFARSPQKRARRLTAESCVSRLSIMHTSETHKWHPWKNETVAASS